jgi:hypothetical protein
MTSALDERLDRLENVLQEVAERQRLSRFDNLMFLAYPLVLAGQTGLANLLWNSDALKSVKVGGLPFEGIVLGGSIVLGVALFWTFLIFIQAYVADDLLGRIMACHYLMETTIVVAILPFTAFIIRIGALPPELASVVPGATHLFQEMLTAVLFFVAAFALILLWQAVTSRSIVTVCAWFHRNVPRRFAQDGLSALETSFRLIQTKRFRVGRILMIGVCSVYAVIVVLAALVEPQTAAYRGALLIGIVAMTLMMFLGKRLLSAMT